MPQLLSVNVGLPRDIVWEGRTVRTAVWKHPVEGRRMVRKLNIDGDGQGDLAGHGGEHRAVFVYQMESHRYWQRFLERADFSFGQFGENFTVDGLADDEVCIGDRYRIGDAIFEVTQPRVTCYRVGIRLNEPRIPALLVSHRRPGFYFRVLQEGAVGAGDAIVKIAEGPERLSVADVDALLYLPGHAREQLERTLRVPALSAGWRSSFEALLKQDATGQSPAGNPGLASEEPVPAWSGFQQLRVVSLVRESASVTSLLLAPADNRPLPLSQPGQFVVLRLPVDSAKPPLLRSYSLSDQPRPDHLRISVKNESNGIGSDYLCNRIRVGDLLDVSAPRGLFTLRTGDNPVVLIGAGVGATPVMAMLHALVAENSQREVWWIQAARNGLEHPFAEESRSLLRKLARANRYVVYSRPTASDRAETDFDASGHIDVALLREIGVPQAADFYLCGPTPFLQDMRNGLREWGVANENVHMEVFGAVEGMTPGMAKVDHTPHPPKGPPGSGPLVSFTRSGITTAWDASYRNLLELAEACDVPVRWSCRAGVCHTCNTGLIEGPVGYQPQPVELPAEGSVLLCCCRPEGPVALDL
jgi:ferredoxin-NADP reductase/MOSC domain-containing protein YiiM